MIAEAHRPPLPARLALPPVVRVGLLCLALVALVDTLVRHQSHLTGDEPFYERMAVHPSGPHNFPYAYRIVVPWLAHVLPFSTATSFRLLAWLGIAAAGGAMYALLQEFAVQPRLAVWLVIGFVLSPTLLVVLPRDGISVDPASVLVMVLGCLFIVRRQKLALAVTILIGAGVKETSLYLIPLAYAVWAERLVDRDALRDVTLVSAIPIAAYIVLRASIDAVGNAYTPEYTGSFIQVRLDVIRQALSGIELRRLAYTYGPLWLVAPFALRSLPFARRGLVLVALCVASIAYSFDLSRIIFLAAPVFYVAAAWVLRARPRLAVATVVALLAVDVGYGIYLQVYGVQHGIDTTPNHLRVY